MLHNIVRYTDSLKISSNDRLTLLQSCGFSGAVSNIFTALLNGAVLLPFDVRARGVPALAKWLVSQEPTIYHSVPSLFRDVMRTRCTLPTLRIIRLEGDLVRPIDLATFNRHFDKRCILVNGLGATETGITAQYFIEHGNSLPGKTVPVGKATRDICIDVVDVHGQPMPQGHSGEIVITSSYLAKGYWRRPDLTESAFSPIDGEARRYRTGDQGCIDQNGLLQMHGRVDSLTKIRGEWVDLSALEASLARCTGVKDAIAGVRLAGEANPELTVWIVPDTGVKATSAKLRERLRSQGWPRHSTPTRFVFLEHWPLDLNGKVDRGALAGITVPRERGTKPQTPLEQLVADVFERILDVAPVARTDDFFELGGDSLKAVEACLEFGRLTGSSRALDAIQHASNVAELAQILSGAASRGRLVPLQPHGERPALFCVHAHMGHVFNLRQLAGQFAPEQPFFGLQAKGLDRIEPPETKLEAMAATYVACIRKAQPNGPFLIAGYCFGSWVAVEIARQLCDSGQRVRALFLIDPSSPAGMMQEEPRSSRASQLGGFLERLRGLTARRAVHALHSRLTEVPRRARIRLLWYVAHWFPAESWLSRHLLHRPADAIALMELDYRPAPYNGDACILVPSNTTLEAYRWKSYIKGNLEIEPLVGSARDLLREPYTRDLAACLLGRINTLSE